MGSLNFLSLVANMICELGFVFGKMKVLDWPMSRKWDFGLYAPTSLINGSIGMTLSRKYLVLYSVKWKYWNVLWRENEILAYMVTILINMKVELVPWFKTWYLNLFGFKFGKMKVLKRPLSRSLIYGKFELVPCCRHDMWT